MSPNLEFLMPDGVTTADLLDWGTVPPGESGAALVRILKNTGDAATNTVKLGIDTVGEVDLEGWITGTVGGQTFTAAAPLTLPGLAAGASLSISYAVAVPGGVTPDDDRRVALPYADWT